MRKRKCVHDTAAVCAYATLALLCNYIYINKNAEQNDYFFYFL